MRNRFPRHKLYPVQPLEARDVPAVLEFTVAATTNTITLSGNLNSIPFTPQGTGALVTSYSGSNFADVDLGANSINFLAGGILTGAVSGTWQPAVGGGTGSAPANYGGAVAAVGLVFAVRDGTANFTTASALTMTGSGATRSFPSTQVFTLLSGTQDYNAGALGTGTGSIGNSPATNSSSTAGGLAELASGSLQMTTPLIATYTNTLAGNPLTYILTGTLTGNSPFPVVDPNGAAAGYDTSVNFTSGGSAVTLAPQLETRRNPSANLTSAMLVLSPRPDGAAESLTVNLGTSGLTSSGYSAATGTLTLSGSAPLATYQSVLRTVAYANSAASATAGVRTVSFTTNDGVIDGLPHFANVTVAAATPAPRVSGFTVNAGQTNTVQRSRVTSIAVTFNAQVTFAGTVASAFTVSRINGGAVGGFTASQATVGGVTVVTLTGFTGAESEFGSLADGRYTLTALAAQITAGGVQLDGDGNGTGGDNYVLTGTTANGLFRLFGDVNGDGSISGGDFGTFRLAFGLTSADPGYLAFLDYDGNGAISGGDFGQFRIRFGTSVP